MRSSNRRINYLNDSPAHTLWAIILPLISVHLLQIGIGAITNKINSQFVGPEIFTLNGYLSNIMAAFSTISSGVASAAWIKTAHFFLNTDKQQAKQHLTNALTGILLVEAISTVLQFIFIDALMALASIPPEIYRDAKIFFMIHILGHLPVPLAAFFLMILNGTGSPVRLFLINLYTICTSTVVTIIMLAILKTGIWGAAAMPTVNALLQIGLYLILLGKDGFLPGIRIFSAEYRPNWRRMWVMIHYGLIIALQTFLCQLGYLVVSISTNRCLTLDFISVLSINLPLSAPISALSAAITAFVPQNYSMGRYDRSKKFLLLAAVLGVGYGLVCLLIYALCGRAYYTHLLNDPQQIAYGAQVWLWHGIGVPCMAVLSTLRFYMDAIGRSKLSLLSGAGELIANLLCAFWIIPTFGNIGRIMSPSLGWAFAAVFLIVAYLALRKRFYPPKSEKVLTEQVS